MPGNSSVSLQNSVVALNNQNSALFMNRVPSMRNIKEEDKIDLNPVEFLATHYDIVSKVNDMLTKRHGDLLTKGTREEIEQASYNDIVTLLIKEKLTPKKEKWLPIYIKMIFADIFGYGILETLLEDESIDEIMVVKHDKIFIEQHGKIIPTNFRFASVDNAKGIVTRFIAPLNKRLDSSSPNVDAQLPDGSRLSATIAPLRADNEISIDIRKFKNTVEPLEYYVNKYQSQAEEMAVFEEKAIASKLSMIVSGGTGSGKTTLLNALSIAIPNDERLITVEDTLELRLQQDDVESYQTIEPNMEGKGGFTMQQMIVVTLRKRPDRIIVGECRGPEIVEMLNAMNTGHEGSLSTIHANSPSDMISRASTMIRSNPSSSHLEDRPIFEMLDAIDLIVQTSRLPDGSRRIMNVTEVVGVGSVGFNKLVSKGKIKKETKSEMKLYLQDIFRFRITGTDEKGKVHGYFEATGYIPFCLNRMKQFGHNLDESFFAKRKLLEV